MKLARLGLVLCVAACGGDELPARGPLSADSASGALHAIFTTSPDPVQRGVNEVELTLSRAGGATVEGEPVTATPWMPSHGHGSAVTPEVTELGSGRYHVKNVYLAMPGTWQLRIGAVNDEVVATFDVH